MKVLVAIGAGWRAGAERALWTLVRNLPAAGIEPVVAALAEGPFLDELEAHDVRVRRLPPVPRARQVWKTKRVVESLTEVADDEGADVIQASGEKMGIYTGRAARRVGAQSVIWGHDAPTRDIRSTAVQGLMTRSPHDAVVVPSHWMARSFRRRLGLRTRVIPHGVDLRDLPAPGGSSLRADCNWGPETVVIGHFGRLQRWKGAEEFLEAAAYVVGQWPSTRFVVVGGALFGLEERYAARLPELAAELELDGHVRFLGHRDDALSLMAQCDAVVHSSTKPEPFGMVVLEAMALGRAVVASTAGAPPELVVDGVSGLLAPPGNAPELASAMSRLAGDRALRERLGAAATEEACRAWSGTAMAERFAALYRELVIRRQPERAGSW